MTEAAAPAVRDPLARLKGELSTIEKAARERLKGTSVETMVNRLKAEARVDELLDAVLDRAGLVRKAKVAVVVPVPTVAEAGAVVVVEGSPTVDAAPARH